jgi:hypothetical protein
LGLAPEVLQKKYNYSGRAHFMYKNKSGANVSIPAVLREQGVNYTNNTARAAVIKIIFSTVLTIITFEPKVGPQIPY